MLSNKNISTHAFVSVANSLLVYMRGEKCANICLSFNRTGVFS